MRLVGWAGLGVILLSASQALAEENTQAKAKGATETTACGPITSPGMLPKSQPIDYSAVALAYEKRLHQRISAKAHLPPHAPSGSVLLQFRLEPSGKIECAAIAQASGSAVLDAAALEALKAAPPEPLPDELKADPISFRIRLNFRGAKNAAGHESAAPQGTHQSDKH